MRSYQYGSFASVSRPTYGRTPQYGGGGGGSMGGMFNFGGGGGGGKGPLNMSQLYGKGGTGPMAGGGSPYPQMPYQPMGPQVQGLINTAGDAAKGLLDPSSAYHQRMRSELSEDIGSQSEAQQRAAVLRAAQAGLGAGASPELLETQADIGRTGQEAYGDAAARALLGGMELGGSFLSPAISGQLGLQGQQMQAYLAQQQATQNQEAMRWQQAMQNQQFQQEMMLRQLALLYGL